MFTSPGNSSFALSILVRYWLLGSSLLLHIAYVVSAFSLLSIICGRGVDERCIHNMPRCCRSLIKLSKAVWELIVCHPLFNDLQVFLSSILHVQISQRGLVLWHFRDDVDASRMSCGFSTRLQTSIFLRRSSRLSGNSVLPEMAVAAACGCCNGW